MKEPTTEAGRRLLDIISGMDTPDLCPPDLDLAVAAIEAEARAAALAAVEVRVRNHAIFHPGEDGGLILRQSVLDDIREEAGGTEPT